jgi:aspartate/methionine/tyrosine aminotransferase
VVIDGLSKSFAMTGWRLGWLHGPAHLVGAASLVYDHTLSCAPTFIQDAAVVALTSPASAGALADMVATYRSRRALVLSELSGCVGLRVPIPQGAFYLFPDVRGSGLSGDAFSSHLLEATDVGVLPGAAFGEDFASHVRMSLATPDTLLIEGIRRFRGVFEELARVR